MTNIQIALRDRSYARELRQLLACDGKHRVYIVDRPEPEIGGVVVADVTTIRSLPAGIDMSSLVVLGGDGSDLETLWDAGVRLLLPSNYPPYVARVVVLGVEMQKTGSLDDSSGVYTEHPEVDGFHEEISNLRLALADAVQNSAGVVKALQALSRLGGDVEIEISAVLVGENSLEDDGPSTVGMRGPNDEMYIFGERDKSFLRQLRISEI